MKRFTSGRIAAVAMVLGIGLSTAVANAGILSMSSWEGNTSAGYSANFGNPGVNSTFDDALTFSIPSDASGNGTINVVGLSDSTFSFTKFTLWEGSTDTTFSGATGSNTSSLNFSGGAAPGQYRLNVAGTRGGSVGSYAGNIVIRPAVVSAIPEPETYAMLLAGLGLLGYSARRRKNDSTGYNITPRAS